MRINSSSLMRNSTLSEFMYRSKYLKGVNVSVIFSNSETNSANQLSVRLCYHPIPPYVSRDGLSPDFVCNSTGPIFNLLINGSGMLEASYTIRLYK